MFCEVVRCGQYATFIWSPYILTYEYLDHSTCIFKIEFAFAVRMRRFQGLAHLGL